MISAMLAASRYVRPGVNRLESFLSSLSTFPSFCWMIGVTTMLLAPRRRICSRISCSAPLPMASMAMTEATPKRMPNEVRPARSLLWPTASAAVRALKATCAAVSRARSARPGIRGGRRKRHTLRRVATRLDRRHRLQARNQLDFQTCLIGRWDEQQLVALLETPTHHDLVVVHRARLDLLLHDVAAVTLVDEG